MRKISFLVFVVPLLFAACKSKCIEDSGKHLTKELTLKVFDEIKVSGPIKLILQQDSSYTLRVSADSNVIDVIKAEVSGKQLTLALDPSKYCGKDSIVVHAGIGELTKLIASGNSMISSEGISYVKELEVDLSDTTTLNLNLYASTLKTSLNGKAQINLNGQTGVHEVKSNGSFELNAFNFVAGIYDLDIEGVGKTNINVLNELKVRTSGSSEIYYKGNPKKINEKKDGIGKLEKVN